MSKTKREKIILSLTSWPGRIGAVDRVVKSLLEQSVAADEIILYLSGEEFPNAEKGLPEPLLRLADKSRFRIEWADGNLKSHKKYFYALQERKNDIVITVDDDVIYSEKLIEDMLSAHECFPEAVLARRARIILRQAGGGYGQL